MLGSRAKTAAIPNSVKFHEVNFKVGDKQILDNVAGSVGSGRLLAIMGPTGAGKTSLLRILANRVGTEGSTGDIRFGGHAWSKDLHR